MFKYRAPIHCCALLLASAALAADLPWYMRETAMTDDGRLTFLEKPWWPQARALQEGASFKLDLNKDGRPDCIVTRRHGHIIQAIDDSGRASEIWNEVNTAYLVSHKGTGLVDRMVVYIDNDGDGKADEMEMRNYQDGYLRYAWFGENYDKDGLQIFALHPTTWHYFGDTPRSKFRGNVTIYLNKYDPKAKSWVPFSECPFSFWDGDRDGHSDTVLRVSAAPLDTLTGPDADYANNYKYMWAPEAVPLAHIGNLNVRLSYNIDPRPRREDPVTMPHSNFGFTMVGKEPYRYRDMGYTNPRRRPPQTVMRIPWRDGMAAGVNYPARETGFTWDEARSAWRWEGQFWVYERVYLSNTGAPTVRFNMRREYSNKPSDRRRIYYSEADRRYHLLGASEAWMEAGHLVNKERDLEFRWFDKDGDGCLDWIEVFEPGKALPVRVNRFDPRARPVELDREALIAEYNGKVLPEAIAANQRFLAELKKHAASPLAAAYEAEAARSEMAERKRYCLDIARELLFLEVRDALFENSQAGAYPGGRSDGRKFRSMEAGSPATGYSMGDSLRFWDSVRLLERLTDAYAGGRLDEAGGLLREITKTTSAPPGPRPERSVPSSNK